MKSGLKKTEDKYSKYACLPIIDINIIIYDS